MSAPSTSGWAVWFTGLPASGKTSVARELQGLLLRRGIRSVLLDSDELRSFLAPHVGYSAADRDWLYTTLVAHAACLTQSGINVLIAATAHRRRYRAAARAAIPRFAEVYVRCAPDVCRQRDPKGLYRRAAEGQLRNLPGADLPYEPPQRPAAVCDTDDRDPLTAAREVLIELQPLFGLCHDR